MGAKKKTSVGLLVFNPLCMVKAKRPMRLLVFLESFKFIRMASCVYQLTDFGKGVVFKKV